MTTQLNDFLKLSLIIGISYMLPILLSAFGWLGGIDFGKDHILAIAIATMIGMSEIYCNYKLRQTEKALWAQYLLANQSVALCYLIILTVTIWKQDPEEIMGYLRPETIDEMNNILESWGLTLESYIRGSLKLTAAITGLFVVFFQTILLTFYKRTYKNLKKNLHVPKN